MSTHYSLGSSNRNKLFWCRTVQLPEPRRAFRRLKLPPFSGGSEGHLLCKNADGSELTCWRLGCWFSANQRCSFGNSSSGSKLVLIRVFWVGYWLWTVWKANGGQMKSSAVMAAYLLTYLLHGEESFLTS